MTRAATARLAVALSVCLVWWAPAYGQARQATQPPPRPAPPVAPARLVVTVTDSTGGVIQSATVNVVKVDGQSSPADASGGAPMIEHVTTSPVGVALLTLPPGRYTIQAEFQGLQTSAPREVVLRSGDNRQTIVLTLPRMQDSVSVSVDRQVAAADRGTTFATALTREQIAALSDDPDELKRQLQDIAGQNAVFRVDSFEGSELPPKAQIKSIHITRDGFAAENHFAGALFIDIITQPGLGPVRGGLNFRLRDGSMSGRSPFTPTKGPEQTQNYGMNLGGSLIKERSSFSLSVSGTHSYDTSILNAAVPGAYLSQSVSRKTPRDNVFISGLFDYALTKDQTLRASYNQSSFKSSNLGIGAYDLPEERGYASEDHSYNLRLQEAGPLGRRFFTNTRVQLGWSDSESRSNVEKPTIRVNDAFTSGGQQVAGGRHSRTFNVGSDLDYVRGIHSIRTGVLLDGGWHRSDDRSNYLGTYTFESLEAYQAGVARSYTRRDGEAQIDYFFLQAGAYLQDDIRVRRNLTFSPGVRYEALTHVSDFSNFGPRFGVTWAPFRSGRTTLRASAGIFYDWLTSATYEQSLRVDGFRQRELNIVNPVFDPITLDPGDVGVLPAANRYRLGDGLQLPMFKRLSTGIDQTINSRVRVGLSYAYTRGSNAFRGNNLNAPIGGVRPDPGFANIVQTVSDGRSAQHSVNTNFSVSLARTATPGGGGGPILINGVGRDGPPPPPPPGLLAAGGAANRRFDWRRLSINGNYSLGRSLTNAAEGAFGLPATGTLGGEWGPAANDVRQRVNLGINSSQLRNLNANLNVNLASGSPYNIRTGRDDNGDLVFNDRPAGVSRNGARGDGQITLNANFAYSIAFGRPSAAPPPGIQIVGVGGGAPTVTTFNAPAAARYRVQLIVSILNLTNHANYGGYSGVMTSPFFRHATTVTNPRKVDVGLGFNF